MLLNLLLYHNKNDISVIMYWSNFFLIMMTVKWFQFNFAVNVVSYIRIYDQVFVTV